MLTGLEILRQASIGGLLIEPFDAGQLNPNSYDVRLGPILRGWRKDGHTLDPQKPMPAPDYDIDLRDCPFGFVVLPDVLWLGHTFERIGSDRFVPSVDGKSSLARMGVSVHLTAGMSETGFEGQLTLEITAVLPIVLRHMMLVGQIVFDVPVGEITKYKGRYQGQTGVTESLAYLGEMPSDIADTFHSVGPVS